MSERSDARVRGARHAKARRRSIDGVPKGRYQLTFDTAPAGVLLCLNLRSSNPLNRLRRKFDATDTWIETKSEVEHMMDDGRKIN